MSSYFEGGLSRRRMMIANYLPDYLTFIAREAGTFTFTYMAGVPTTKHQSISYSLDGKSWVTANNVNSEEVVLTTPTIPVGCKVYWKGTGTATCQTRNVTYCRFSSDGKFDASGNIMSILYGDSGFESKKSLPVATTFNYLFYQAKLVVAKDLVLPATSLKDYCYAGMFQNCSSLLSAPKTLPASVLAISAYSAMFQNCTSLVDAPELPATTLAIQCYYSMFMGCSNLANAPTLPARTLQGQCYSSMFYNCKKLTIAPVLPALTLVGTCYGSMFRGCSNLIYIKMMATDISASGCLSNWVNGVNGAGTFVKNSAATWENTYGNSRIPTNFTVITESE